MEWERERPSSFARALFLSNALRRRDVREQSDRSTFAVIHCRDAAPTPTRLRDQYNRLPFLIRCFIRSPNDQTGSVQFHRTV